MGYFDGLGDYNNSFGIQQTPAGTTNGNTTNGNSAKWQTGDSYSEQNGNANSRQFGNKNSFQRGWSNSLLEGVSFSTNLAATFSQLVGVGFSTQTAGSVTAFLGPKVSISGSLELSVSKAAKYTWVKNEKELNGTKEKTEAAEKKEKFVRDANEWLETEHVVAKNEIKKIMDGTLQYVKLTTDVASQDTKTVGGPHRVTAALHKFSSAAGGSITVAANVLLMGVNLKLNGAVINIG